MDEPAENPTPSAATVFTDTGTKAAAAGAPDVPLALVSDASWQPASHNKLTNAVQAAADKDKRNVENKRASMKGALKVKNQKLKAWLLLIGPVHACVTGPDYKREQSGRTQSILELLPNFRLVRKRVGWIACLEHVFHTGLH